MIDLYKLPRDSPDLSAADSYNDPRKRVEVLEEAFRSDVQDRRFLPYLSRA